MRNGYVFFLQHDIPSNVAHLNPRNVRRKRDRLVE